MTDFHYKTEHLRQLMRWLDLAASALLFLVLMAGYSWVRGHGAMDVNAHYAALLLILFLLNYFLARYGARNRLQATPMWDHAIAISKSVILTMLMLLAVMHLLKLEEIRRSVLLAFLVFDIALLLGLRVFLRWWYFSRTVEARDNYLKVLIIGTGRRARMMTDKLMASADWGVEVVGYLDPENNPSVDAGLRAPVLGRVARISEVLRNNVVEEVIVAVPRSVLGDIQPIIEACEEEGVKLRFMADLYEFDSARIGLSELDGMPLLSFEPVAQDEAMLLVKRIFDIVCVLLATPVLVPVFGIVALAIKLDSPGPVFFGQERVGLHKRLFKMLKFRSMVPDAEARMKEIEHLNEAEGPIFKIKDDPRVTRVGKFLRKTSLDELPQLLNVLRGQMSLVGPRPMSLRDVELFDRGIQRKRFSVRPGLTCIWQISGRSNLPFEKWLELDLQYIDSWSFWLDVKILAKTVPIVLRGSGAV